MYVYRSRFLTRGEVWFDEAPDGTRVDWVCHRQRSTPLARGRSKEVHTRLIELQKTPGELLGDLEERTARKISDAQEKDKLRWEPRDRRDLSTLDEAEAMWNQFALAQKTALFERAWMDPFLAAGALDMAAAKDPAGNVLAYHLVLITPHRARQLVAISPYRAVPSVAWRNAVSRANCFVHWKNFLAYREQGIQYFDFGGWHVGKTDIRYLGMNAFKKSFGGEVVREYECEQPVTAKAWVLLTVAQILARLKRAAPRVPRTSETRTDAIAPKEHEISPAFR